MNLESQKVTANKSQQEMFNFLIKVENYEQIMPSSIEKFVVTAPDTFLFGLKGMPEIKLQIKETVEPNKVILGSTSDKLDFRLHANIEAVDESTSEVQLLFDGNFNAMMAMMVKGPLQKFIDALSQNIQTL